MRSIEKLTAAMFPDVYDRLLRPFAPYMPRATLEAGFVPRGWHDEDHFGYVLLVDGKPAGLLGALFSRRQINGQEVRFCNLHNWYVQPEHPPAVCCRCGRSLVLRDCVITDLSASGESGRHLRTPRLHPTRPHHSVAAAATPLAGQQRFARRSHRRTRPRPELLNAPPNKLFFAIIKTSTASTSWCSVIRAPAISLPHAIPVAGCRTRWFTI